MDDLPPDILARAKQRGLTLGFQRGCYVARRAKREEFAAPTLQELRRWLGSSESLPIRTT